MKPIAEKIGKDVILPVAIDVGKKAFIFLDGNRSRFRISFVCVNLTS